MSSRQIGHSSSGGGGGVAFFAGRGSLGLFVAFSVGSSIDVGRLRARLRGGTRGGWRGGSLREGLDVLEAVGLDVLRVSRFPSELERELAQRPFAQPWKPFRHRRRRCMPRARGDRDPERVLSSLRPGRRHALLCASTGRGSSRTLGRDPSDPLNPSHSAQDVLTPPSLELLSQGSAFESA